MNENAFLNYTNFGRNDFRETFFQNIYKINPGELLVFDQKDKKFNINKLLNFNFNQKNYSEFDSKEIIRISIHDQLVSDVPIALSLSGGVDSNIIYSVMREKFMISPSDIFDDLNNYKHFSMMRRFTSDVSMSKLK